MKRFLKRNWPYLVAVAVGAMVMPAAIDYAAEFRGFRGGVGGEFFIIPTLVLLVYLVKGVGDMMREVFGRKEENDGEVTDFGAHQTVEGGKSCR